jgi:transaldolase
MPSPQFSTAKLTVSDRYMIKIPTTSAGVNAAKNVLPDGIRCLGTALFSVHQAIAASQAEMLAISPYFNETRAHVQVELWPDVEDPATQHPMANRMIHIRDTYKKLAKETGKTQPLIKAAS